MHAPSERWRLPLLLLAFFVLFAAPCGLHDWWYPDEPDVALPAIEMAARGDWVVPTHNDRPWLDYPPLAYWAARIGAGGSTAITPFATRWPMALFACIFIAATVLIARVQGNQRYALAAGLVLLSTPTVWFHASNLQVDLGYAMAITLGLWCYVIGDGREVALGWAWRIGGFAWFGLAILGKGPLGMLLPGLILFCWHAWNREWRRLLLLAPLALVSLVVASPWYLFLIDRLGADFVWQQFHQQNFDRFGASNRGHGGKGLFYYFINSPADLGLWIVLLLPAIWYGFRHRRTDRSWRLLILWLLAPLLFFTIASTKRNVYLLPAFPAMALLIADWLANSVGVAGASASNNDQRTWAQRWQRWSANGVSGVLALVGIILVGAGVAWGHVPTPKALAAHPAVMAALQPAALVLGLLTIVTGVVAWLMARRAPVLSWMVIGGATTFGYVLALWLVMPAIDQMRSFKPAAAWIAERVPANEPVGFFVPGREANKRPAWLCHLGGRRLVFFPTAEAATQWLAAAPGRLVISDPKNAPQATQSHIVQEWNISSDAWLVLAAGAPAAATSEGKAPAPTVAPAP